MGDFIKWRDEWKLGIDVLDQQHRHMADCLNRLVRACEDREAAGAGGEQEEKLLAGLMDELYSSTREHFRLEENMMRDAGYPGYTDHAREHHMLLAELKSAFAERLAAGCCNLDHTTLKALKTWFVLHVSRSDREFAEYLSVRPATA